MKQFIDNQKKKNERERNSQDRTTLGENETSV